jgi:hypothetical protein
MASHKRHTTRWDSQSSPTHQSANTIKPSNCLVGGYVVKICCSTLEERRGRMRQREFGATK